MALETVMEKEGSAERTISGVSVPGVSRVQEIAAEFVETEVKLTDEGAEARRAPVEKAKMNAKITAFFILPYIIDNNIKSRKVIYDICNRSYLILVKFLRV